MTVVLFSVSCASPILHNSERAAIRITVTLPAPPASRVAVSGTRLLSPSTRSISVAVTNSSGGVPDERLFTRAADETTWTITVDNLEPGTGKTVTIVAKDIDGTDLTSGTSGPITLTAGTNTVDITLLPVSPVSILPGASAVSVGDLPAGKARFYSFTVATPGYSLIARLSNSSSAFLTGSAVYGPDGKLVSGQTTSGTDITFTPASTGTHYLSIPGSSLTGGTSSPTALVGSPSPSFTVNSLVLGKQPRAEAIVAKFSRPMDTGTVPTALTAGTTGTCAWIDNTTLSIVPQSTPAFGTGLPVQINGLRDTVCAGTVGSVSASSAIDTGNFIFIDPVNGSDGGTGLRASPIRRFRQALSTIRPGSLRRTRTTVSTASFIASRAAQ